MYMCAPLWPRGTSDIVQGLSFLLTLQDSARPILVAANSGRVYDDLPDGVSLSSVWRNSAYHEIVFDFYRGFRSCGSVLRAAAHAGRDRCGGTQDRPSSGCAQGGGGGPARAKPGIWRWPGYIRQPRPPD